jgi:hypothetical protein
VTKDTDHAKVYEAFGGRSPGGRYTRLRGRDTLVFRRSEVEFHPDPWSAVAKLNADVLPSGAVATILEDER